MLAFLFIFRVSPKITEHHFGLPLGQEWRPVMIVDRITTLTSQEAGRSPTI